MAKCHEKKIKRKRNYGFLFANWAEATKLDVPQREQNGFGNLGAVSATSFPLLHNY